MGWFRKKEKPQEVVTEKKDLWMICPSCKAHVYKDEWDKNFSVCPQCNFHDKISWKERMDILLDPGTFREINEHVTTSDPLAFKDSKGSYAEKAQSTREKTGMKEAVITGRGKIHGIRVVISIMDFRFLGGSLASGTGEKILLASEYALRHKYPYIVVSASGGARMHEGIISLMQMAKTCAGIARLKKEGIPYISILTDPTTGGVSASFATMGDINIAEPKALIGFAGRRVIEETIKQKLPDDFQTAEYVLDHGFIDKIVNRKEMKNFLYKVLRYWKAK